MRNRTLQVILFATLFLSPLVASAQRDSTQLSPDKIKSTGLVVTMKDKQSEQRMVAAAKRMNVDRRAFELKITASASLTPDLTIANVGMGHDLVSGHIVHVVVVENKGKVDAGPCALRFMYGMTWDALESIDLDVPGIPAGKSAKIIFTPPDKKVHWWMLGVDVDNKLGEANFSNNLYVIEFKDTP